MWRRACVLAHRCIGLGIACFLICAGLTGSVLVWRCELDGWLNPDLFKARAITGPVMSQEQLARSLKLRMPDVDIFGVEVVHARDASVLSFLIGRTNCKDRMSCIGSSASTMKFYLHPVSAEVLGSRWNNK